MNKVTTASSCCEGDDWLVVSCNDGSREFIVSNPQANAETRDKRGLETSQIQNQIFDSDHHSEQAEFTKAFAYDNEQQKPKAIYQLLVWQIGLKMPIELVDETQKPLMVVADKNYSLKELEIMVQEMVLMQSELRGVFPQVTRENVSDVIQVCERLREKEWVPLKRNAGSEELQYSKNNREREDSIVTTLQLTSKVNRHSKEKWRQLLVESRYEVGPRDNSKDWRRGRFYSDNLENTWRFQLQIGQLVDALDTDKRWYESRIVDMDALNVKVHYRGWTSRWNEWLSRTSTRIAQLHTKVPDWRVFQVGDVILVGSEVPEKRYPEWRIAYVTACDIDDGTLQIEVDVDGKKKWFDAQDELLCVKGTHKAVNTRAKVDSFAPPSLLVSYFERPEKLLLTPSEDDVHVKEAESAREATYVTQLAGSDADGDEWCVVDDRGDRDDEGVEVVATESIIRADDSDVRCELAGGDPDCSAAFGNEQCEHGIVPPAVDQFFTTVLDGEIDTVASEKNAWRDQLQIDQLIDACDTDNVWYESRVVALSSKLVKLHYRGWTSKWDEWIERASTRMAPLHTKVRNWRDFKLGSAVMVGRHVGTKKYPEWRNAAVTACKTCKVDNRLRIQVDVDGRKHWMDAQDEMLCPPGTHTAFN